MTTSFTEAFDKASKKSKTVKKQLIVVKKYCDGKEKREKKYMERLIPLMDISYDQFVKIDNDKPFFEMAKPYIRKVCKRATNADYNTTLKAIQMVFVTSALCSQRQSWQIVYDNLGMPI